MWNKEALSGLGSFVGPPGIVAGCAFLLHLLPIAALTILTAWTLASFPIGVLIGHCALSEE